MTRNPECLNWQKSSYSEGGDGNSCIELAAAKGSFMLRESDDPQVVVTTTGTALTQLIRAAHHGLNDGHRP